MKNIVREKYQFCPTLQTEMKRNVRLAEKKTLASQSTSADVRKAAEDTADARTTTEHSPSTHDDETALQHRRQHDGDTGKHEISNVTTTTTRHTNDNFDYESAAQHRQRDDRDPTTARPH